MDKTFVTKDSGARQEFKTGSVRDKATGKGRYDLIPTEPLRRLAGLYERGAAKYGDRNWEKGQPLMRYIDSMMRHVNCLVAGEPDEDHAAAIAWNVFGYMHTLSKIESGDLDWELDDRPAPEAQYAGQDPARGDGPATRQEATPESVLQLILGGTDPQEFAERMVQLMRAEVARRRTPDAQLVLPIDDTPDMPEVRAQEPFTAEETAWFNGGEPAPATREQEELARCHDPHCQMCPLEPLKPEQHPLMRMARRGGGQ
jgi:hypothetical protein